MLFLRCACCFATSKWWAVGVVAERKGEQTKFARGNKGIKIEASKTTGENELRHIIEMEAERDILSKVCSLGKGGQNV